MTNIVFHHYDEDGRLAAAFVKLYSSIAEDEYIPIKIDYSYEANCIFQTFENYNEKAPTDIYFVDYCPTLENIEYIFKYYKPEKVFIFDHHKTRFNYFESITKLVDGYKVPLITRYAEDKCGAHIVQDYLFEGLRKCNIKILNNVEDYDLWKMKDREDFILTNHYAYTILSVNEFSFALYEEVKHILNFKNTDYEEPGYTSSELYEKGVAIYDFIKNRAQEVKVDLIERGVIRTVVDDIPYILINNTDKNITSLVNSIFMDDNLVVGTYTIYPKYVSISFRSKNGKARLLAEKLDSEGKGGGHDNAAGCSVYLSEFIKLLERTV